MSNLVLLFCKHSPNRKEVERTCTDFYAPQETDYKKALKGNPLSYLTTMYDRSVIGDLYFDETYNRHEDYIFWLTILKRGIVAKGNHNVLATYVIHSNSKVIGNRLMNDFLGKIKTKVLILSGDIYQIPSIEFGNWFHLAKVFLPEKAKYELTEQFRTGNDVLKTLWSMVRKFDHSIAEYLTNKRLVTRIKDLDNSFFNKLDDDEIILCLNYDGLYGVNCINSYLQTKNPNPPVKWYHYTFKVGDPILFSDIKRFDKIVYNNLKGIIKDIKQFVDRITFQIAIDRRLSALNFRDTDIHFIETDKNGWTVVEFSVYNHTLNDFDGETNVRMIVPFHVAYAVSIHKAQGLEYNSVKIMISNSVEEKIDHNIFYTAITRAKEKLMIYWTPETEKTVLTNFKQRFNDTDYNILKKYWGI